MTMPPQFIAFTHMFIQQSTPSSAPTRSGLQCSVSPFPEQPRERKRFNRSGSGDRSKSKEQSRSSKEPLGFYIKNATYTSHFALKNFLGQNNVSLQLDTSKKPSTPIKEPKQKNITVRRQRESLPIFRQTTENLQKKCEELTAQLAKSQSYISQLQTKVYLLEELLNAKQIPTIQLDKVKDNAKEVKGNTLSRLRKQIAETRASETTPDALVQRIKNFENENFALREDLKTMRVKIKQQQAKFCYIRTQKEDILENIVEKLRISLFQHQRIVMELKTQLGILRLKESKQPQYRGKKEQQVGFLRDRLEKLHVRYQQAKKYISVLERKQRQSIYFTRRSEVQDSDLSFDLLP